MIIMVVYNKKRIFKKQKDCFTILTVSALKNKINGFQHIVKSEELDEQKLKLRG